MEYALYLVLAVVAFLGVVLYRLRKPVRQRDNNLKFAPEALLGEESLLDRTEFIVRKRGDT